MNEFIAERKFCVRNSDGSMSVLRVGLDKPYPADGIWECAIQIEDIDGVRSHVLSGPDSLDALVVGLWALERQIDRLKEKYRDNIWQGEQEREGFEVLRLPDYCLYREPLPENWEEEARNVLQEEYPERTKP